MSATPPITVVGAGIAGLCTALAAAPRRVRLLCRHRDPLACASSLAQGGIAAAVGAGDSPQAHAEDTLIAGAHRNDAAAVRWLTAGAAASIDWLAGHGVVFDAEHGVWRLSREGGHSRPRVLHIGGDASGRGLIQALTQAAAQAQHIDCQRGCELTALALDRWQRLAALRWRDADGALQEAATAELVLATGSLVGGMAISTHPRSSDGAGLALAMACGALTRDLHYIQFHPTAWAGPALADGRRPLITEALRGAGAELRDGHGQRFMPALHPLAELAPRDLCARAVQQARLHSGSVWLHAEQLDLDWPARFPGVLAGCLAAGIDPRRQPIPVAEAAHYQIGGIHCDLDGRSSVEGLSVVGELASSGVHGGNRLASNSLLEAVSGGRRLGARLRSSQSRPRPPRRWQRLPDGLPAAALERLRELNQQVLGPSRRRDLLHAAVATLRLDPELAGRWQSALWQQLMASALADRTSCGAHFWDKVASAA